MKKHLRSVLTLLLVVMMAFGVVAPVIGYAADSDLLTTTASKNDKNSTTVDSYDAGWLKIEQLQRPDGSIELVVTVSPDVNSLKELDAAQVKEIAGVVLGYAKSIVIDQLKDSILGSQQQPVSTFSARDSFNGIENIWESALDNYITGLGYESGDYLGFFQDALVDESLMEGLADYACNLLTAAYIGGQVDLETLKGLDIESTITNTLNTTIDDYIQQSQATYVEAYVKYLLGDDSVDVNETIRSFADDKVAEYLYDYVETCINAVNNGAEVEPANKLEEYVYNEISKLDDPEYVEDLLIERKDEIKEELRTDAEVRAELKVELKDDLKADLKDELKDRIKVEFKGQIKADLENKLENDPSFKTQLKNDLKETIREELRNNDEFKDELFENFMTEILDRDSTLRAEIKAELRNTVFEEVKAELEHDKQVELARDLSAIYGTEISVEDPRFQEAWEAQVAPTFDAECNAYFEENFDDEFDAHVQLPENEAELQNRFNEYFDDNFDTYFEDNFDSYFDEHFDTYFEDNFDDYYDEKFDEYYDEYYDEYFDEYYDEKFDEYFEEYYDDYFDEYFDNNLDDLVDEFLESYEISIDDIFADNSTETVINFVRDLGIEYSEDILDAVNSVVDEFLNDDEYIDTLYESVIGLNKAEFDAKIEEYAAMMADKVDATVADLEQMESEGGVSLTPEYILSLITDVSIGGEVIYSAVDADTYIDYINGINFRAFAKLASELPNFYEIANMANADMKLSYDIIIGTLFADIGFTVTLKVGGGYDEIRTVAGIISEYIDVQIKPDGTLDLDLRIPAHFSKLLLRAAQNGHFSDALKNKIFAAFMVDGNDVYGLYEDLTFEDLLTLISSIDYEGLLDREFIQHYVDLSGLTNEKIDEVVARYEGYFTILKNYADKVVNKVENRIPDRFMDNSILSIFDYADGNDAFSYENGTFGYVGTHTLPAEVVVDKAIAKLEQILPAEYLLYVYIIEGYLSDYIRDYTASVDISVHVEHINKVEYVVDGTVIRTGFLPVGADVNLFSDYHGVGLIGWANQYGEVVTSMPDYDVRLTALFDGKVSTSGDITKVYDGKAETVWVRVGDTANRYTYAWYDENGNLVTTSNSFTVKNVVDSGVYTYYAYLNGEQTHTGTVTVKITPATVEVSGIGLTETLVDYDGETHTVGLTNVPDGITATILSGNVASEAGKHTVVVSLTPVDTNYVVADPEITLTWNIKYVINLNEYTWSGTVDEEGNPVTIFTYSGDVYEFFVDGEYIDLLELEYDGNTGKDVGRYTATVSVSIIDVETTRIVGRISNFRWQIKPLTVYVSNYNWIPSTHTYNGMVQTVELDIPEKLRDSFSVVYVTYDENGNVVEAVNAGNYVTTATLTAANGNLTINDGTNNVEELTLTHEWTINPKTVDLSTITWNYTGAFTYDGTEHTIGVNELEGVKILGYENNVATDAGTYVAKVIVEALNGNYALVGTAPECEWTINPLEINVDDFTWTLPEDAVYNGEEFFATLNIPDELKEIISVEYTKVVNAGTYTTVATLTCGPNYTLTSYELTSAEWTIAPKTIDLTTLTWNYENPFTYNKAEHTVLLNLPVGVVVVEYANNVFINAGKYTASAIVAADESGNYVVAGEVADCEWVINPKTVDVSLLGWNYLTAYIYNGAEQSVLLSEIPEGVVVEYLNNAFTNAGTYTATAIVTADNSGNYVVSGEVSALEWTIDKAPVDYSSIKFEDATVTYNGKLHSLAVAGDADVLAMFDITYTGNGNKLIGVYTVTATLTLKSEYTANYVYGGESKLTAKLTITGTNVPSYEQKNENGDVIIKIEVEGGLPADVDINIDSVVLDGVYKIDGKEVQILVAYDIHFTRDGQLVNFDGKTFKVSLLIPAEYRDFDSDEYRILYVKPDGTIEVLEAERVGDYMVFTTTHFSIYAIGRIDSTNLVWLWILISVLLVAGAAAVVVIMIMKKKEEENAPAPDEIPEVEAESTETTEEEASTEEEVAEEEVTEETEEEPAVEETEEEIPEVEETVEEAEEEPVAEEEEPVVEEETETVAEPVTQEVPKTAVLVMGQDGKDATAVIGGETVHIRFRSSLMSRLIQSSENVQTYYTTIKNYLLSYKGVKARGSWNYEAFNKGRIQCAKLNIKGKTLIINLNLNPADFNINKYHFIDVSDKPKFAKVPMMMKVRSDRAVKYTLELIDEMMKLFGIPQLEIPTVDYHMPYETTEELAMRGLVKVILPAGVTLSDDLNFVHMNVTELIESGTNEKTTEQILANENEGATALTEDTDIEEIVVVVEPMEEIAETTVEEPVVEEPVVEEPVVEEPVVEEPVVEEPVVEEPVVEEPVVEEPVVEEPVVEETVVEETVVEEPVVEETVADVHHVDADTADELVSDEEAESRIEIVHTGATSRSGKMGEINLDTICENYEDGDTVNVDTLKEKHLINNKIARVKVLARGVMTKRLTVVASKFSLQAVKMITLAGGKAELED